MFQYLDHLWVHQVSINYKVSKKFLQEVNDFFRLLIKLLLEYGYVEEKIKSPVNTQVHVAFYQQLQLQSYHGLNWPLQSFRDLIVHDIDENRQCADCYQFLIFH